MGSLVVLYGPYLTYREGNASEISSVLYYFKIFIKWFSWGIALLAVIYTIFTSGGWIRWLSYATILMAILAVIVKLSNPHTHYSEHIFNGLEILGFSCRII